MKDCVGEGRSTARIRGPASCGKAINGRSGAVSSDAQQHHSACVGLLVIGYVLLLLLHTSVLCANKLGKKQLIVPIYE